MLALPRVGLGTAPLGGMFADVSDDDARETVGAAIAQGWSFVDTAPHYGRGLSERRVGAAVAGHDDVVVSTKVGRLVRPLAEREPDDIFVGAEPGTGVFDFSAAGVRCSLQASLERLGRERVDLALVHDPEAHLDEALQEAVPALVELRDAGVVGAIGVGTNEVATALRFVTEADVDAVLIAGRITLLDGSAEAELLPACVERGVAVIAGGVFNSGVLADPSGGHFAYGSVPDDVRARVQRLQAACERHGVPLAAAAIQHPLRVPGVTSIVVGCRSAAEVATDAALLEVAVPDELWAELR